MTMVNMNYYRIFKELNETGNIHKDSNILIIDGMNTFMRAWAVNPQLNTDGLHVGGVVGFFKSIGAAIKKFNPTRVIVVFDGKGGSKKRKAIYPDYKENRTNKLRVNRAYELHSDEDEKQAMKRQVIEIARLLQSLPVITMVADHVEADDIISYLATDVYSDPDNLVTIMSSDKDFLQLVSERITVWAPTKKTVYTPQQVYTEYGVTPKNFLILRIFSGDVSDNIKGIKGVGDKTLLKAFPIITESNDTSIETILTLAEQSDRKLKIHEKILEGRDILERNFELMQLHSPSISSSNKMNINDAAKRSISTLNRVELLTKMKAIGVIDGFPNIHNWLQDTFIPLNRYAGDSE